MNKRFFFLFFLFFFFFFGPSARYPLWEYIRGKETKPSVKIAAADTPTKKTIYRIYSTNIPEEEDGEKMSSVLLKNKNRLCSKTCGKDRLIQMNFLKKISKIKIPTGLHPKVNLKT